MVRVGGLEFNDSYEKTFLVVEVRDSQKEQGPETTKVAPFVKYGTETNIWHPNVFHCICVPYTIKLFIWDGTFGTSIIGFEHVVVETMQTQAWYDGQNSPTTFNCIQVWLRIKIYIKNFARFWSHQQLFDDMKKLDMSSEHQKNAVI